jgi:predicted membrane protein
MLEDCMTNRSGNFFQGSLVMALCLICIGVLLLFPHLGYDLGLDFDLWNLWPLILVFVGVSRLVRDNTRHRPAEGVLWILFGLLLLGRSLGLYYFHSHLIWPLLLIAMGVLLLSRHVPTRQTMNADRQSGDTETLQAFWVLGGGINRVDSKSFKGGSATSFLSNGKIDLLNADLREEAVIDVFSFLGKIEIFIPENWEASIQVASFLGSVKNKTGDVPTARPKQKPEFPKRLVIKGMAMLGDIEVSNG